MDAVSSNPVRVYRLTNILIVSPLYDKLINFGHVDVIGIKSEIAETRNTSRHEGIRFSKL